MKDQPQPSPALRKALGWGRGRTGRKGFGRAGAPSTKKKAPISQPGQPTSTQHRQAARALRPPCWALLTESATT